jgi:hypothetical protein
LLGSVSRVAAPEIEDAVVRALNEHRVANMEPKSTHGAAADTNAALEKIERIDSGPTV